MKKILWIAKFPPGASQIRALEAIYPGCRVDHEDVWSAEEAADIFRSGYDDLVAVVPLAVFAALCRAGLNPLWSEAAKEANASRVEFRGAGGQGYRFDRYMRVRGVRLDLVSVETNVNVKRIVRFTRHEAIPAEIDALRDAFPNAEIGHSPHPFRNGREVLDRATMSRADEISLVASWGVYDQLVKSGVKPLFTKVEGGAFQGVFRLNGVLKELVEL